MSRTTRKGAKEREPTKVELGFARVVDSFVGHDQVTREEGKGFGSGTNVAPFPFIHHVTQGYSKSFHYQDLGASWDYEKRNAFFGTFTARGVLPATAGGN